MDLLNHGIQKFPKTQLLASSQGLGWHGVAAEVRSHPACEIAPIHPVEVEVTIAICGERGALVSRKGVGLRQETPVLPGQIWISPVGVVEDDIRITKPLSRILHIYLPTRPPEELSHVFGGRTFSGDSLRYLAGVKDDLILQIGASLMSEMANETAGSRVLAESLGNALMVRLLQAYCGGNPSTSAPLVPERWKLDRVRVRRVIEYMTANLESDIGLDDLAAVAGLSNFHFTRMFKSTTGVPPYRYLANLRLEAAKELLAQGDLPVAEIAAASNFSTQTNFARAFKQFTGMTPGEYRALFRDS